jgi:hypothetical protein
VAPSASDCDADETWPAAEETCCELSLSPVIIRLMGLTIPRVIIQPTRMPPPAAHNDTIRAIIDMNWAFAITVWVVVLANSEAFELISATTGSIFRTVSRIEAVRAAICLSVATTASRACR